MIEYLIVSSTCMLVFFIFYQAFLVKDTFFERNRFYLLFSMLLSLLLPLQNWFWLTLDVQHPVSKTLNTIQVSIANFNEQIQVNIISFKYLLYLYFFISIILLLRLVFSFGKLVRFIKKAQVKHFPYYRLIETKGKLPTFCFLNYVFWDNTKEVSTEAKEMILLHEIAHIKGKHTYDILLLNFLQTVFWCNPMFYFYKKAIKNQHEFIADRLVLHQNNKKVYSRVIVEIVFKHLNLSLSHGFNQHRVKKRLTMMHKLPTPTYKVFKVLWILPVIFLFTFLSSNTFKTLEAKEVYRYAEATGGMNNFYKKLQANLRYPQEALVQKIEGKVYLKFTVTPSGKVKDVGIQRSSHEQFNQAALDAFHSVSTTWKPAIVDGKPVSQKLVVPLLFRSSKM